MADAVAEGLTPAGVVVAAHGVRGYVRVKTFTESPATFDAYGPLTDAAGDAEFPVRVIEARDTVAIVSIAGVKDRNGAERLKGKMLYLRRDALPPAEEDEFFHADLIGLDAVTAADGCIGTVAALYDYGAGDLIEIELADGGAPLVLPFTVAAAPKIDLDGGVVHLAPPAGLWPRAESKTQARKRSAGEAS